MYKGSLMMHVLENEVQTYEQRLTGCHLVIKQIKNLSKSIYQNTTFHKSLVSYIHKITQMFLIMREFLHTQKKEVPFYASLLKESS